MENQNVQLTVERFTLDKEPNIIIGSANVPKNFPIPLICSFVKILNLKFKIQVNGIIICFLCNHDGRQL